MLIKACVVIPVYNHGATLRDVVQRALAFCPHVLVVDDGSTDGGTQSIADLPVMLHKLPYNQGKGKALLAAVQKLQEQGQEPGQEDGQAFTHMISLDADAQHYPEDLPLFFAAMERNPEAIIIGNRDFSASHIPKSSRFGRAFSGFWMWVQTGQRVSDMQSGYRVYPLSLFSCVHMQEAGYAFEVEVLVRAAWAGFGIQGIAIQVLYQQADQRISHFHALRDNMRISWLNTRLCAKALCWYGAKLWQKYPLKKSVKENSGVWSSKSLGGKFQHGFFRLLLRCRAVFLARAVLQVVVFYYTLLPSVRYRALPYIQHRFGKKLSAGQKFYHTWQLYRQFGEVLLCRMLHTEKQHGTLKATESIFKEKFHQVLARQKGCLVLTAHVGGWQSGMAALEGWNIPLWVLLWRDPKDVDKHYFENQAQNKLQTINAAEPLAAMVQTYKALKEGGVVLIMGDRLMDMAALRGEEASVSVPFLQGNIRLPIKAYALASKLQVPLVVQFTVQKGAYTQLWCCKEIVVPAALPHGTPEVFLPYALEYAQELERFVQENPYQFFNFHNIWQEK